MSHRPTVYIRIDQLDARFSFESPKIMPDDATSFGAMTSGATSSPYSTARSVSGLLFVSGQLGRDATGRYADGVTAQTAQVLRNLRAVLEAHELTLNDVVKCQVFLSSIDDWSEMNNEYIRWFEPPYPARSAFGTPLVPGALVEIEAVASLA